MPVYQYKARDRQGRLVEATLEAEDLRTAARLLRERGFFVTEIKEPGRGLGAEVRLPALERGPGLKDLAIFSRQLATMLSAGLTLLQSLSILEKQTENKKFREIIRKIRLDVEGGSSFSEALAKHPLFSRLYVNLVRAGETSGGMDQILDRIATFLEKELELRGKIRSAMTYPTIVFVFAVGVAYFLLTGIVPQFAQILTDLGSELPLLTRFLIALSELLRKSTPFLLLLAVALFFAYRQYYKTEQGRRVIDRIKLRLPVFGNLNRKTAIARFSRTLALLLSSGVNILEALEIVKGTAGNKVVEEILEETRLRVQGGDPLNLTLAKHPFVFPPMVSSMVAIGEETGALEALLTKIADFYEREVDQAVASLTAAIEPLMIIFMGAIVGMIVAGMFLPLFKIIGTLSAQ
ncbi:MAG: phytochrome sensor protein [Thermus sp.]|uniref:type II secretion system F family protein n=1 Tax=Thermus sp. TaxID=275 RepID=UPI0033320067